ncbi:MAG: hypothetical protein GX902_09500 [Lentisphaerae bacterium]|jgi:hypothetical protein|nr:hypothetical protein [Lentisphaerota bacterium]
MKTILTIITAFLALQTLWAGELNLRMPFKPGRLSPIAWWDAPKGRLFEEEGKFLVALEPGSGMRFKHNFTGNAGDVIEFTLTMRCESGPVSIRLGQYAREGWIGERAAFITEAIASFAVYQGEILLENAVEPDKDGVLRKVSEFSFSIHAHPGAKQVVIENIKAVLRPKEEQP